MCLIHQPRATLGDDTRDGSEDNAAEDGYKRNGDRVTLIVFLV